MKFIYGVIALICVCSAIAGELKNVTMPDEVTVRGKKLVLNGMGLREVDILSIYIKVYVGGLYLEKKSSNGDEIISSPSLKQVRMQFLRHVSPDEMRKSWEEGISKNCQPNCDETKQKFQALKPLLPKVDEGDVMNYTFDAKSVELELKGQKLGSVESEALVKAMLGTWVGSHPVTNDLKSGLLGAAKK